MSQIEKYTGHALQRTERMFQVTESQIREMETNRNGWRVVSISIGVLCITIAFILIGNAMQGDKVIIIQSGESSEPKVVRY